MTSAHFNISLSALNFAPLNEFLKAFENELITKKTNLPEHQWKLWSHCIVIQVFVSHILPQGLYNIPYRTTSKQRPLTSERTYFGFIKSEANLHIYLWAGIHNLMIFQALTM